MHACTDLHCRISSSKSSMVEMPYSIGSKQSNACVDRPDGSDTDEASARYARALPEGFEPRGGGALILSTKTSFS
jgi:hypothetical protein